MKWWGSKPQSVTAQYLDSITYCYVSYLSLPDIIIPSIATTRVHPLTWASPVSKPASPSATRGHSPTWASLVSVPACRLPTMLSLSLPVRFPTACPYPHRYYSSLYLPLSLPGWPEVVSISPLGATTHPSCDPLPSTLSTLHTPQIRDVAPPTAPRLPIIYGN